MILRSQPRHLSELPLSSHHHSQSRGSGGEQLARRGKSSTWAIDNLGKVGLSSSLLFLLENRWKEPGRFVALGHRALLLVVCR